MVVAAVVLGEAEGQTRGVVGLVHGPGAVHARGAPVVVELADGAVCTPPVKTL